MANPRGTPAIYVVTTVFSEDDDVWVGELELLDVPPGWKALKGQSCRYGNVNGGDSLPYLRQEDGWGQEPADHNYDPEDDD